MKRLYRSKKEVKIAGVCSGMGDYFEKDPVIFRLLFLISFFLAGPFLYIIAWIIIPTEDALEEEKVEETTIEDLETQDSTQEEVVVEEKNEETASASKEEKVDITQFMNQLSNEQFDGWDLECIVPGERIELTNSKVPSGYTDTPWNLVIQPSEEGIMVEKENIGMDEFDYLCGLSKDDMEKKSYEDNSRILKEKIKLEGNLYLCFCADTTCEEFNSGSSCINIPS